jgi:hypothetical protein
MSTGASSFLRILVLALSALLFWFSYKNGNTIGEVVGLLVAAIVIVSLVRPDTLNKITKI